MEETPSPVPPINPPATPPAGVPTTPVPPANLPETPQPNIFKTLFLFLLALILLAGIAFAYFQFGPTQINLPGFSPKTTPTPISQLSSTSTPTPDETTDWKIYKPNNRGRLDSFSFRYPKDWQPKEPDSPQDINIAYIYSNETINIEGPEKLNYYLYISPTKGLPNVELTNKTINGYYAYRTDELPSRLGSLTYLITNNGNDYISLSLTPYNVNEPFPEQNRYVQIFDLILSTFRFLDDNFPDTSDWKTYLNTKYGFQINYPKELTIDEQYVSGTDYFHGWIGKQIFFSISKINPLDCRGDCPVINNSRKELVRGLARTKLEGYVGSVGGETPQNYLSYVYEKSKYYYAFTLYELEKDNTLPVDRQLESISEEKIKLFNQILSTFRFLE